MSPKEIKDLRNYLGLSQKEFGQLVGVTHITICRWERDHHPPIRMAALKLKEIKAKKKSLKRKLMQSNTQAEKEDLIDQVEELQWFIDNADKDALHSWLHSYACYVGLDFEDLISDYKEYEDIRALRRRVIDREESPYYYSDAPYLKAIIDKIVVELEKQLSNLKLMIDKLPHTVPDVND